jgi:acetylornithine/succinyldiaminopimelate/putrescine aminotransferase
VWSSGGRILDGRDLRCVNIGHRGKAFFVETIEGAGGVIIPPVGCLLTLREAYRGNENLFVADEMNSGFGRLGC